MSAQLESVISPPRRSALRRLWQQLPQRTRGRILFDVSRALAPAPDADPRGGFPLGIAGLFSTASGIGEGARLAYAALEAEGHTPAAFDLSAAFGQTELPANTTRRALAPSGGSLIVHHNGPFPAARALGARPRTGAGAAHHRLLGLGTAAPAR